MDETAYEATDSESPKKKYTIIFLLLLLLSSMIICVWGVLYYLNKPLSPSLDITQEPVVTAQPATQSSPVCSETGKMLILVIGVDLPETDLPKGADAIRYVEVDFSNEKVTLLAIPRDLWVQTPSLNSQGYTAKQIGQTYFIGKDLALISEDEIRLGTSVLAQTIYDNFGLIPIHYITLNMEAFADVIDTFGGVRINIPQDFQGGRFSFSAGDQYITGDMLMDYSRTFLVGSEWDRLARQDLALAAIKAKILSGELIPEIPALFSHFSEVVSTDLTPQQLINLGCMVNIVENENIFFNEISPDMISFDVNGRMLPDVNKIRMLMEDLFSN